MYHLTVLCQHMPSTRTRVFNYFLPKVSGNDYVLYASTLVLIISFLFFIFFAFVISLDVQISLLTLQLISYVLKRLESITNQTTPYQDWFEKVFKKRKRKN